jgi:2-phospho-L-lactate guanylyltransferase (CobY/MobA/RfbA family)
MNIIEAVKAAYEGKTRLSSFLKTHDFVFVMS